MPPELAVLLQFAFVALSSVFFVVDPLACIPAFLASTAGHKVAFRRRVAFTAGATCLFVLAGFALTGTLIFQMFAITMPAFKIAGGVLLFLIALDMLQARRSPTQGGAEELREAEAKEDPGMVPLGVPMLAGPGSISTVMVLMGQARDWRYNMIVFGAIIVTAVASYVILMGADRIRGVLRETGTRILVRMMGLILAAVAVQFVLNALSDLGLLRK